MLIGFIVVVVILVIIGGVMAVQGTSGSSKNAVYVTEAKKVQQLISHIKGEAQFYFLRGNTYLGVGVEYLKEVEFVGPQLVETSNMSSADWIGWPQADGGFPDPYFGPYISVGGPAKDNLRIIITSLSSGEAMGIYILRKKDATIDPVYTKILEKVLGEDANYIGG